MIDQATHLVMNQASASFKGTGCPQPASTIAAADFDSARFDRRPARYVLVPLSNGSRRTFGVLDRGKQR